MGESKMSERIDVKIANMIIAEYMDDDSCMCLVNSACPSPSLHHKHCLNKDCKKKINKISYQPYVYNLDSLLPVWERLGIVDFIINVGEGAPGAAIETAKKILKRQDELQEES